MVTSLSRMFCGHMTLVTWFAYLSYYTIYILTFIYLDIVDQMFKTIFFLGLS